MVESNSTNPARTQGPRQPLSDFALLAGALGVGLGLAATAIYATPLWVLCAFGVGAGVAARGLWGSYPHHDLGLCNAVTLVRLGLTALLFGALFEPGAVSAWAVFWIAVAAFALDGVDGYLARHSGLASRFGARFDMETDAALGAILATWLLLSGAVGPAILILGYLRYAFVVAGWILPALRAPLPEALRRKAICVAQIGALIFITLPGDPWSLDALVSLIASGLLLYSFGVDSFRLLRRAG
jgi:phosphatidylglycerophosphate synthase